jgi:hypothetical protein
MHQSLFQQPVIGRACWTCEWWEVEYPLPYSASCLNPECARLRTNPQRGCASWVRATGCDDEELKSSHA